MTATNLVDHILACDKGLSEVLRALSVANGDPRANIVRADLSMRFAQLAAAETLNVLLADLLTQMQSSPVNASGDSFEQRAIDLAMGPSPELLATVLAATEGRLSAEQRENERLRAKLAAYEPPPPVGVPAVDRPESPA